MDKETLEKAKELFQSIGELEEYFSTIEKYKDSLKIKLLIYEPFDLTNTEHYKRSPWQYDVKNDQIIDELNLLLHERLSDLRKQFNDL